MKLNLLLNYGAAIAIFTLPVSVLAQFSNPESVTYDELNRTYYMSSVAGQKIVKVNAQGQITGTLKSGLNGPFGLKMYKGTLYFADVNAVKGINPATAAIEMNVPITGISSGGYLNDIEIDSSDFLYVSYTGGGKIFKINLQTHTYTTFVDSGLTSPNGLLLDNPNNRLLLNSYRVNSPIQAISLLDSTVSTIKTTNLGGMDGFVRDNSGNYYISAWIQGAVYKFDSSFAEAPILMKNGLSGPADMYHNPLNDTIIIPLYNANKVEFINLKPTTDIFKLNPEEDFQYTVFPNPSDNGVINISYILKVSSLVNLKLINLNGEEIELLYTAQKSGKHQLSFNYAEKHLAKGIYAIILLDDAGHSLKRVVLFK